LHCEFANTLDQADYAASWTGLFKPALGDPFESMFNRFMAPMWAEMENGALDMRLDVTEVDGKYNVCVDIPGFKKDDINVRIDGNIVQIDAAAKKEKETGATVARCCAVNAGKAPCSVPFPSHRTWMKPRPRRSTETAS
jgi:HSP20 family molecular chaperone IbpA